MKIARSALLPMILASLAFLAVPASVAHADPEPEVSDGGHEPWWRRIIGAEIIGGADTPYGVIGGAVIISPVDLLAIDLGGGASRDGGRVAGGVRFMFPQDRFALGLRLGFAGGPLTWSVPGGTRVWDFTAFINTDVSLEYRTPEGFYGRLSAGVETGLAGHADRCTPAESGPNGLGPVQGECEDVGGHPARPYVGLSIGYMFDT